MSSESPNPGAEDGSKLDELEVIAAAPIPEAIEVLDAPEVAQPVAVRPPSPPHPNFWWAILWCLLFLVVAQIIPALIVVFGLIGTEIVSEALANKPGADLLPKERVEDLQKRALMPTFAAGHVAALAFSCLALRLVAGKGWTRQIGLRPPRPIHLLLALLLFPALPIVANGVFLLAKEILPSFSQLLPLGLAQLLVFALMWLGIRVVAGRGWKGRLAKAAPLNQLLVVTGGTIVALLLGYGLFLGLREILPALPNLPGMEDFVKEFRDWPWPLAVLVIGLGPGICEELWCRGFLGRGLVGQYGPVLGIVLTSYLFGAIHGLPDQGTMAAILGLVLHFTYLTTRSLFIPMLLHFLNNALSVVAHLLDERFERIDSEPENIPLLASAMAVVLLAAGCWALYRSRVRFEVETENGPQPWQPEFDTAGYPPRSAHARMVRVSPGWIPLVLALLSSAAVIYLFLVA
jgi:membrane protease YdiL (CAAX protease family)